MGRTYRLIEHLRLDIFVTKPQRDTVVSPDSGNQKGSGLKSFFLTPTERV